MIFKSKVILKNKETKFSGREGFIGKVDEFDKDVGMIAESVDVLWCDIDYIIPCEDYIKEQLNEIKSKRELSIMLKKYFNNEEIDKKMANSFDACGEVVNDMMDNSIKIETDCIELVIAFGVSVDDNETIDIQFIDFTELV